MNYSEMKENINILFVGGAKRLSLAERFIDAGKKIGKNINIFSYELTKEVPICSIATVIEGLLFKDPKIIEHLLKTLNDYDIDIVFPNVDPAISILAQLKQQIKEKNKMILVSPKNICDIFFNKKTANKWFVENGINVPENSTNTFPIIAKPIEGSASRGIKIIKNQIDFKQFCNEQKIENYLIQKYIESDQYTVDCYISTQNNKILAVVPRKRLEVIDGEVSKSITVYDQQLIEISKQIIKKANFQGPINIQFLKEKNTQKIYLMEINPRFGGGVINSIEAGVNMPLMVLNDYLQKENQIIENWKPNLLMMRANREVFLCK